MPKTGCPHGTGTGGSKIYPISRPSSTPSACARHLLHGPCAGPKFPPTLSSSSALATRAFSTSNIRLGKVTLGWRMSTRSNAGEPVRDPDKSVPQRSLTPTRRSLASLGTPLLFCRGLSRRRLQYASPRRALFWPAMRVNLFDFDLPSRTYWRWPAAPRNRIVETRTSPEPIDGRSGWRRSLERGAPCGRTRMREPSRIARFARAQRNTFGRRSKSKRFTRMPGQDSARERHISRGGQPRQNNSGCPNLP